MSEKKPKQSLPKLPVHIKQEKGFNLDCVGYASMLHSGYETKYNELKLFRNELKKRSTIGKKVFLSFYL